LSTTLQEVVSGTGGSAFIGEAQPQGVGGNGVTLDAVTPLIIGGLAWPVDKFGAFIDSTAFGEVEAQARNPVTGAVVAIFVQMLAKFKAGVPSIVDATVVYKHGDAALLGASLTPVVNASSKGIDFSCLSGFAGRVNWQLIGSFNVSA